MPVVVDQAHVLAIRACALRAAARVVKASHDRRERGHARVEEFSTHGFVLQTQLYRLVLTQDLECTVACSSKRLQHCMPVSIPWRISGVKMKKYKVSLRTKNKKIKNNKY